jgi:hypothetical protein
VLPPGGAVLAFVPGVACQVPGWHQAGGVACPAAGISTISPGKIWSGGFAELPHSRGVAVPRIQIPGHRWPSPRYFWASAHKLSPAVTRWIRPGLQMPYPAG